MLLNQIIKIDVIDDLAVVGNLNLVNVVVTFVSVAPSKYTTQVLLNDSKEFLAPTEDQRMLICVLPVIFSFMLDNKH